MLLKNEGIVITTIEGEKSKKTIPANISLDLVNIKKIIDSLQCTLKMCDDNYTIKEWLSSVKPKQKAGFQAAAIAALQENQLVFLERVNKYIDYLTECVNHSNKKAELEKVIALKEEDHAIKAHENTKEHLFYTKKIEHSLRQAFRTLGFIWENCMVKGSRYDQNFSLSKITGSGSASEDLAEKGSKLINDIALDLKFSSVDLFVDKKAVTLLDISENIQGETPNVDEYESHNLMITTINSANKVLSIVLAEAVGVEGIRQISGSLKPLQAYRQAVEKWAFEEFSNPPELWGADQKLLVDKMHAVGRRISELFEKKPHLLDQSKTKNGFSLSGIGHMVSPRYQNANNDQLKEPESSHSLLLSPRFNQPKQQVAENPSLNSRFSLFSMFSLSSKPLRKNSDNPIIHELEKLKAVTVPPTGSELNLYLGIVKWVASLNGKEFSDLRKSVASEHKYQSGKVQEDDKMKLIPFKL